MNLLYLKVVRRNELCVFQFSELISLLNFFSKFQQWYQSILVLEGPGEAESSTKHLNTYQRVENAL